MHARTHTCQIECLWGLLLLNEWQLMLACYCFRELWNHTAVQRQWGGSRGRLCSPTGLQQYVRTHTHTQPSPLPLTISLYLWAYSLLGLCSSALALVLCSGSILCISCRPAVVSLSQPGQRGGDLLLSSWKELPQHVGHPLWDDLRPRIPTAGEVLHSVPGQPPLVWHSSLPP